VLANSLQFGVRIVVKESGFRVPAVPILGTESRLGWRRRKNDATTKSTGPSAGYFECFVSKQEINVAGWSWIGTRGSVLEAG